MITKGQQVRFLLRTPLVANPDSSLIVGWAKKGSKGIYWGADPRDPECELVQVGEPWASLHISELETCD